MRVDGFGIIADQAVRDLKCGLVLVEGENEAGKSTLLAFVRAVLFGFPQRDRPDRYEPLRGGRHGGALWLTTRTGDTYRVERQGGERAASAGVRTIVNEADGSTADLGALTAADEITFRNIFAFGLQELHDAGKLREGGIQDRVYSAGSGIGAVSVADVLRDLEGRAEDIYRPRGRKTSTAELLRSLQETRQQIQGLQQALPEYQQALEQAAELEEQIEAARQEVANLRARKQRLESLQKAWPSWLEMSDAQEELDALPQIVDFPADGVTRLEAYLEAREERTAEVERLQQAGEALERELAQIVVDEALVGQQSRINALHGELQRVRSAIGDLPRRQEEAAAQRRKVKEALEAIGPDWDRSRAEAFDLSVQAREAVATVRDRLQQAGNAEQQARHALESAESTLAEAGHEVVALSEPVQAEPAAPGQKEAEKLRAMEEAERRAAEAISQRDKLLAQQPQLEERRDELLQAADAARERAAAIRPPFPVWAGFAFAVLAGLGSLLVWGSSPAAGAIFLALAVGGLVLGAVALYLERDAASRRAEAESQAREARHAADELQKRLDELQGRLHHLDELLRAEAAVLGQSLQTAADLVEVQRSLRDLDSRAQRLRDAVRAVERARAAHETAQGKLDAAQERLASEKEKWAEWLDAHGLRVSLTPEGALETFTRIATARREGQALDETDHRVERIRADIEEVRGQAAGVFAACVGALPDQDTDLPAAIEALHTDLGRALAARDRRQSLRRDIESKARELRLETERLAKTEDQISQLLAAGAAEDEEAFRQRAEAAEERHKLQQQLANAERALKTLAGTGEDYEAFVRELSSLSPGEIDQQHEDRASQLAGAEKHHQALANEQGELREQRRRLEVSDELSAALQRQEALRAELRQQAADWARAVICKHLLDEARATYEKERQPRVLQEASALFERVTGGRYVRVMQPLGEQRFKVEPHDGVPLEVEELSRGTREQLLLCIRLGLIREYARHEDPLPLVLDEVLVNFDPHRAEQTAALLAEFAHDDHQVLLFTCHPEMAQLFASVGAQIQRLRMKDGQMERVS